jgi:xylulokinase
MALLGLDLGTTATKAVAFSEEGTVLAVAQRACSLHQPRPGWAERDPEEVWAAARHVVRTVAEQCPEPIEALAMSSQGEGIVPVDADGKPLGPFIVSFDRRSRAQADQLGETVGRGAIFAACGQILHPMGSATKILWWRQHQPGTATHVARYLCAGDYVMQRMGLEPVIDPSVAARTMLYDMAAEDWSAPLVDAVGITARHLARVQPAGTTAGRIPAAIAADLGLATGARVVVGGHDQACAGLGVGAVMQGDVAYSLGTTETLVCPLDRFIPDLGNAGYPCYPHVLRDRFLTLAGNFTGGVLLQWYRDTFGERETLEAQRTGRSAYEILLEEMAERPTQIYVLPHFTMTGTPWNDPDGVGAIVGLGLSTTKAEITRALLEGVTYEIALNLQKLEALGMRVHVCRAVGGGTRAARLLQLKADVLGRPLIVPKVSEAACCGAALLAGQGIGLYPDPAYIAQTRITMDARYAPCEPATSYYRDHLEVYKGLYPLVKALNLHPP